MDPRFQDVFDSPENSIFHVVFFPDRVYHALYLNATRCIRYKYAVREVRSQAGITAMKGYVFLDGGFLTEFVRLEYAASRLVEQSRERGRLSADVLLAWCRLTSAAGVAAEAAGLALHYCPWVDAWQVELWRTLEPPPGKRHDLQILDQMGRRGPITRVPAFQALLAEPKAIRQVELAFREGELDPRFGTPIGDPAWDNNHHRSYQVPNTQNPSDPSNTVPALSYLLDFRRGFYLDARAVAPVRYRNAMMVDENPERRDDNILEMRWVLQRELGGTLVFFHEVLIPPGVVEGTHWHIGSEELYYIVEGEGLGYMGADDNPDLAPFPIVERSVFGMSDEPCREVPLRAGHVIFTKSGGIHGIRNTGAVPLRFVAFLYQSS